MLVCEFKVLPKLPSSSVASRCCASPMNGMSMAFKPMWRSSFGSDGKLKPDSPFQIGGKNVGKCPCSPPHTDQHTLEFVSSMELI